MDTSFLSAASCLVGNRILSMILMATLLPDTLMQDDKMK